MITLPRSLMVALVCSGLVTGCSSGGGGPALAPVEGTVTYQGSPIAGATVMFIPEKGPLAVGVTDASGKFKLFTGPTRGAVVGVCKASVSVAPPADKSGKDAIARQPKTPEESAEYMRKAAELQQAASAKAEEPDTGPKSPIPEKYNSVDTSGLSYTVKAEGNTFKIEL